MSRFGFVMKVFKSADPKQSYNCRFVSSAQLQNIFTGIVLFEKRFGSVRTTVLRIILSSSNQVHWPTYRSDFNAHRMELSPQDEKLMDLDFNMGHTY